MGGSSQIQGHSPEPGVSSVRWRNIGATQLADGTWALKVDTELTLDAGNISISNIKVGSVDQTTGQLRFLKTLDDGTLVTTDGVDDPLGGFGVARAQDSGAYPHYFGLVDIDQNWIIIKESKTGNDKTYEYASGAGNFIVNYGNRDTSLVYDEYWTEF